MTTHHCGTCFRAVQPPSRCAAHPDAELLDTADPHDRAELAMLRQLRQSRVHQYYRTILIPQLPTALILAFYGGIPEWFAMILVSVSVIGLLVLRPKKTTFHQPDSLLEGSAFEPERDSPARAQRERNQAMRGRRQASGRFVDGITNQG